MTPLHVSALGGGAWRSATWARFVFFSRSVTVASILSTAVWIWSGWASISNSMSPTFIFTRIGGFCCFSVKFSHIVYCIVQDAHAQYLNISPIKILNIGESW